MTSQQGNAIRLDEGRRQRRVGGHFMYVLECTNFFRRPGGKFPQNNDFLIQIPIWFCSQINSLSFPFLRPPLLINSMVHWHRVVWCRDGLTWIYCFNDHWLYWEIAMALFANILSLICNKNHFRLFHLAFTRNPPTEYQVLLWISIRWWLRDFNIIIFDFTRLYVNCVGFVFFKLSAMVALTATLTPAVSQQQLQQHHHHRQQPLRFYQAC